MKPSREPLGHLELDVLQYVSDHHPISVRDVAAHFAETSGQARTTVLTVMERLRAKGHLSRRKVGGRHHYTPTVPKAELLNRMVGELCRRGFGRLGLAVCRLSQSVSAPQSGRSSQARAATAAHRIA